MRILSCLIFSLLLSIPVRADEIRAYVVDTVDVDKAFILTALQSQYEEFQGKVIENLEEYGEGSDGFIFFRFKDVEQNPPSGHYEADVIHLRPGNVLTLLKAVVPALANKTIDDLESYGDSPLDPSKARFIFKEELQP